MIYKQSSSIAFDETSSYWSAPKTSLISRFFHWSPHSSLVSIGQNFVTTRVVHLPKRTEKSLITESDQSGPNHQLLQLCSARTAWSDSDQAVRAVHSCISSFLDIDISKKIMKSEAEKKQVFIQCSHFRNKNYRHVTVKGPRVSCQVQSNFNGSNTFGLITAPGQVA